MSGTLIDFRESVERIRTRHKPGKLVGLYRGLKRAHAGSESGGWTSVSLLAAGILNQMIRCGSQLWWDIVDLDFHSAGVTDGQRDAIGIRTLAGQIENGTPSPSFIQLKATRAENGVRGDMPKEIPDEEVNARVMALTNLNGLPRGGFYPMFANLGHAMREANLSAYEIKQGPETHLISLRLFDLEEYANPERNITDYEVVIDFQALLRDIEIIRTSLATRQ